MCLQLTSAFMVTAVGLAGVATALWQERQQRAPPLSHPPSLSLFQQGIPQHAPSSLSTPASGYHGTPWAHTEGPPGAAAGASAGSPGGGIFDLGGLSPGLVAVLAAALQAALWRSARPKEAHLSAATPLQGGQSGAGTVSGAVLYIQIFAPCVVRLCMERRAVQ